MAHTRDLYKTKLCTLYQRGNCPRQSCSFAHGEAELRRVSGVGGVSGRQDGNRSGDFRDRLDRHGSPLQRGRSPSREGRGGSRKGNFSGRRFSPRDRGRSRSRSTSRRRSSSSYTPPSERREYKRSRFEDAHWLDSPGAHLSDVSLDRYGEDDYHAEVKSSAASPSLSSEKEKIQEQVRQVQLEKDSLAEQKENCEKMLGKHVEEASVLTAKIMDLEAKVASSHDGYKRTGSKMKKLIKMHTRYSRAQEEAKRTQSKLQKMAEEFTNDANQRPIVHADESNYYNGSDGDQGKPSNLVSAEGVGALYAKKTELGLSEKVGATENGLAVVKGASPSKDLDMAERVAIAKRKRFLAVQEKTRALQQNGGIVRPLLDNDLNLPALPQVPRPAMAAAASAAERPSRIDMFLSPNVGSLKDQQMTVADVSPSLRRSPVDKAQAKSRDNARLGLPITGLAAQARELHQDTELDEDRSIKNGLHFGMDREQRVTLNLMSPSKSYHSDGPGGEILGKDLLSNFYK